MKVTSIKAYDANKQFHPSKRWAILGHLAGNHKWLNSEQINDGINSSSLGGTKSRLRELELMGFLETRDVGAKTQNGNECVSYRATPLGVETYTAGHEGQYVNAAMSTHFHNFNNRRKVALEDLKKQWRDLEEQEIADKALALVNQVIRPW